MPNMKSKKEYFLFSFYWNLLKKFKCLIAITLTLVVLALSHRYNECSFNKIFISVLRPLVRNRDKLQALFFHKMAAGEEWDKATLEGMGHWKFNLIKYI